MTLYKCALLCCLVGDGSESSSFTSLHSVASAEKQIWSEIYTSHSTPPAVTDQLQWSVFIRVCVLVGAWWRQINRVWRRCRLELWRSRFFLHPHPRPLCQLHSKHQWRQQSHVTSTLRDMCKRTHMQYESLTLVPPLFGSRGHREVNKHGDYLKNLHWIISQTSVGSGCSPPGLGRHSVLRFIILSEGSKCKCLISVSRL